MENLFCFSKMTLVGHQKQFESLRGAFDSGKMAHAYIFSGPDKVGKKTLALKWLSSILNIGLKPGTAHPDFLFLAPLVDEKTQKIAKEITVGQIREAIGKLSLTASAGGYKAAIVDGAHLMNSEAQNCLLKTLEEPPGKIVIILIAENEARLLETVRSRAQVIKFGFVAVEDLQNFGIGYAADRGLKIGAEQIKELAELSFGRPGRLADFLQNPNLSREWQSAAKEFAKIIDGDLAEKFAYAKKITDNEKEKAQPISLRELIEIWQYHFRNRLLQSLENKDDSARVRLAQDQRGSDPRNSGKEHFVFSKLKEKEVGQEPEKIAAILKKIQELDLMLRATNAHPRLAIENFFLDL